MGTQPVFSYGFRGTGQLKLTFVFECFLSEVYLDNAAGWGTWSYPVLLCLGSRPSDPRLPVSLSPNGSDKARLVFTVVYCPWRGPQAQTQGRRGQTHTPCTPGCSGQGKAVTVPTPGGQHHSDFQAPLADPDLGTERVMVWRLHFPGEG